MQNRFDDYIRQMQNLEQSDNKNTLSSFCTLNKATLSYFKGIWEPLQTMLCSSNIDINFISKIESILGQLDDIKDRYESLKNNASREYKDDIKMFQKQIDSITYLNWTTVSSRLINLENNNRDALRTPSPSPAPKPTPAPRPAPAKGNPNLHVYHPGDLDTSSKSSGCFWWFILILLLGGGAVYMFFV
ncbi:MAG: hypothetical protein MJZ97_05135 [Bacteroidales bacterium]|nr:hypothetical protein [Bacteroidales bacterium]